MKAVQLFEKKPVLSFEVFPPKPNVPIESIYETLAALKSLKPDFISVTFGAGGSSNNNRTIELAKKIKEQYDSESPRHSVDCASAVHQ